MEYYVRSDGMCSTNVAFNMKTVQNVLISSFEIFLEQPKLGLTRFNKI